jgi:hypothetical protein
MASVTDRQLLAGVGLKLKVGFQAGSKAHVSSAEGWKTDIIGPAVL